jgi:hypothetical protein
LSAVVTRLPQEPLDEIWKPLQKALRARDGGKGGADASGGTAGGYALEQHAQEHVPWYAVWSKAWYRRHFGTDLLLGNWLTLLGCILWMFDGIMPLVSSAWAADFEAVYGADSRAYHLVTIAAALTFIAGFLIQTELAYPDALADLFARLAETHPPPAKAQSLHVAPELNADVAATSLVVTSERARTTTVWDRLVGTNALSRGVAAMNLVVVPFWGWAIAGVARDGLGSPVFLGAMAAQLFFLPVMVLLTESVTDDSLIDLAHGGEGSQLFFRFAQRNPWLCCCCACVGGARSPFFARHFGTDQLAGLWYFTAWMVLLVPVALIGLAATPLNRLAWLELLMSLGFAAGLALQLRASYPENVNSSILFAKEHD